MSTTTPVTLDDLKAAVAQLAGEDAGFRAELLADPKAAVAKALAADLPAQVKIQVVEEAPDTYVVVLPAPASGELSDADLESVAGGTSKAEHNANAQTVASFVFGGALGGTILGIGALADGFKDPNGNKMVNVGGTIGTCGATDSPLIRKINGK